ncbi:Mu transposase domain-containing protein [Streptomyces mirabilis]|uniref:Mu transposase domain-containing protein n=1 Tax=Streptomyces mirabilis TaxID=68239 RepID=UPI00332728EC
MDHSKGRIRADVVHQRLVAMGFTGTDRTTRRAVAEVKAAWKDGRRRYRPWMPEPGMWLQLDWGEGPKVAGRSTQLFCAWLSWSRFRVVIPAWAQTLGTLVACLDATLRRLGGAPAYVLTDNPRTVTIDRVAGIATRHPDIVAAGKHYSCTVATCEPFDPEFKGGVEATVKIAKADLVPTTANLRPEYGSFAELAAECDRRCEQVNARPHHSTKTAPVLRLIAAREHLHPIPAAPHHAALGDERVADDDQTISFGAVRYSTPPGFVGARVWCRVTCDELAVTAMAETELEEICLHRLSTPCNPRIVDAHYPHHPDGCGIHRPKPKPRTPQEFAFLNLGEGAHGWLVEAGAAGVTRVRSKMARAVELAVALGEEAVYEALGMAAIAGRRGDDVLALGHLPRPRDPGDPPYELLAQ